MAQQSLRFNLLANTAGFTGGLKRASMRMTAFGKKITAVGMRMKAMTLPIALAGIGAIKMAADFDKAMTKIKTLVGIAGDEVDQMANSVKSMSKETAVSSKTAADALFFITSAGQRGDTALKTLNISLKATAIGLGETETVARLSTAAMAAYAAQNYTTTQATDTLVAAVREGRLDATQLADSMEMVIPVAAEMGVNFNELSAAFAAVSRTNSNASQAATGLRSIMTTLLNPTSGARDQLEKMGLSADEVRQKIKDDGLLSVLTELSNKFEGNADATTAVFGNVRALVPLLALTGQNAEAVNGIFERMTNTTGMTDKAFAELQKSAEFQLRKSINALKEDFKTFGANLMTVVGPALQKAMAFVGNLFKKFNQLDGGTKKLILGIGALAMVLPFIVSGFGLITSAIGVLMSPVALITAALVGIGVIIYKNWAQIKTRLVEIANYFIMLYNESMGFRIIVESIKFAFKTAFGFAKLQILNTIEHIKMIGKAIYDIFSSAGAIIKAAFTLDREGLNKAVKELGTNLKSTFTEAAQNGKTNMDNFINDTKNNFKNAVKKSIIPGSVNLVDESVFDNFENTLEGTFGNLKDKFNNLFSGGGGGGTPTTEEDNIIVQNNDDPAGNEAIEKKIALLTRLGVTAESAKESIASSFGQMSSSIVDSLGLAGTALGDYLNQLMNTATQTLVENLKIQTSEQTKTATKIAGDQAVLASTQVVDAAKTLSATTTQVANASSSASDLAASATSVGAAGAEATGNAVVSATKSSKSFGPAAAFVLPLLIATAVTLVAKMMKKAKPNKFASGGIVSGTTLGMVGEYPGAKSNPEVIAPLDRLKNMLPQQQSSNINVGGNFTVDGQDLVLALGRANENGERL
jgi:TP901 family phage tail tape measure protein